ncbi:MAG: outer membrane beta-barrel protein [Betaproteobacteria bacterium]|nr:outer membrane beta-barrel protein [Betaproteobacteria bacterium]
MNKYAVAGMLSLALTGTVQGAAAQDPAAKAGGPASPWYVGVGIGRTNASIPGQTIDSINATLSAANGATFSVIDKDKSSTGAKLLVGYSFNRNFAVEGGYAALGKSKVDMDFRSGLNSVGGFNMDYKMSAAFIDAVGILPFAEKWSLIGRLGVAYDRTSANFNGSPITLITSNDNKSESKFREKFGAGVDYNLNPAFTVRAEWEHYKFPDPFSDELFNVDAATLSLLFRF